MNNELFSVCERLLTALLNSAYQGILLVALVWLAVRFLVRTNAATRHAIWLCTLLLVTSLVGVHIVREFWKSGGDSAAQPGLPGQAEISILQSSVVADTGDSILITGEADGADSTFDYAIEEGQNGLSAENVSLLTPQLSVEAIPASSKQALWERAGQFLARCIVPISWKIALDRGVASFAIVSGLACIGLVSLVRMFLLAMRLREVRLLKKQSLPPDRQTAEIFQQLVALSGVRRKVGIRLSPGIVSPVLLGFSHPVILLASRDGTVHESSDELRQVLRHELAHVARRDDWVNLLQQSIQSALFFHPAIWWVNRRLSLEREIACDDHVLQQGSNARSYALLLTNLAGKMQSAAGTPQLAPGISTKSSQLKQRIAMLLDTTRNRSPRLAATRLGLIAAAATILSAGAIFAGPRIVFDQSAPAAPPPPAASATPAAISPPPELAVITPVTPPAAMTWDANEAAVAGSTLALDGPTAESGPRFKTSVESAPAIAPIPPVPPTAAVSAGQPRAPRAMRLARAGSDDSMEERLDRLEKMVESLVESNRGKSGVWTPKPDAYNYHPKPERKDLDRKELERSKEMAKSLADMQKDKAKMEKDKQWALKDPTQNGELKEQIEKQVARATDEARRAGRAAERAMAEQKRNMRNQLRENSRMQLDALRKELEALERQKDNLHRQIERLERDQNKGGGNLDDIDAEETDASPKSGL